MLETYKKYKQWWLMNKASDMVPTLYWGETQEQAFIVHMSEMSTYDFMELMLDWENR